MVRQAHHDHPESIEGSPPPSPSPIKGEGGLVGSLFFASEEARYGNR